MASRLLAAVWLAIALVILPGALVAPADAVHIPTTADFADAGPEHPAGGQYGVQRPRSFEIGVVPVSYDFTASGVRWRGWGSPIAVGRGRTHFCVIMSTCHDGAFRMVMFGWRRVACGVMTHYSYTRFRVYPPARAGVHQFTDQLQVGCTNR